MFLLLFVRVGIAFIGTNPPIVFEFRSVLMRSERPNTFSLRIHGAVSDLSGMGNGER
jgi:hypothetical protein